jgi:hypothetical protein
MWSDIQRECSGKPNRMFIRKENLMNKLLKIFILVTALLPLLLACGKTGARSQLFEQSITYPMLQPGGKIEEMVITTGVEDAIPLWSFCLPTIENNHRITVDCGELPFAKLAIGHTFGVMDLIPQPTAWEELTWQMSLDGRPIDLEAFGTYDFVYPDLAPNPSSVREVFRAMRVWDVVLVNPTLGAHTLQGQAQSQEEIYTWVVKFTVVASLHD